MTLIEFFSPNCRYCTQTNKALDGIEEKYKKNLRIKRINTFESPELSSIYNIRAVPTLILMQDGLELRRTTGAKTKLALEEFLQMA